MVISIDINSVGIYKYILGDLKFVGGLRVHKCTQNVELFSDFDQNEAHFLIGYHKCVV